MAQDSSDGNLMTVDIDAILATADKLEKSQNADLLLKLCQKYHYLFTGLRFNIMKMAPTGYRLYLHCRKLEADVRKKSKREKVPIKTWTSLKPYQREAYLNRAKKFEKLRKLISDNLPKIKLGSQKLSRTPNSVKRPRGRPPGNKCKEVNQDSQSQVPSNTKSIEEDKEKEETQKSSPSRGRSRTKRVNKVQEKKQTQRRSRTKTRGEVHMLQLQNRTFCGSRREAPDEINMLKLRNRSLCRPRRLLRSRVGSIVKEGTSSQSNTDAQEKVMNHKSCFTPVEAPKSPLAESSFGSSIIKEGTTSQNNSDVQEKVIKHKSCFTPVPKSPLAESIFSPGDFQENEIPLKLISPAGVVNPLQVGTQMTDCSKSDHPQQLIEDPEVSNFEPPCDEEAAIFPDMEVDHQEESIYSNIVAIGMATIGAKIRKSCPLLMVESHLCVPAVGYKVFNENPLHNQFAIQQTEETRVDVHKQIILPSNSSWYSSEIDSSNAEESEDVNGSARADMVTENVISKGSATATSTVVGNDMSNATGYEGFNEIPLHNQLAIQQTEETSVDAHEEIIVPSTSSCYSSEIDSSNVEEIVDVNGSARANMVIENDMSNATCYNGFNEIPLYNQLAIQQTEETMMDVHKHIILPSTLSCCSSDMESSNSEKLECANESARADMVTENIISKGSATATSTVVGNDMSNATGYEGFNEIPLHNQLATQQTEETLVDVHEQIILPSTSSEMESSNAEELEDVNGSARANIVIESDKSKDAAIYVVGNDVSNATGCMELNEIPLYDQLAIQETEETSVHAQEQIIMPLNSSEMESFNAKKFEDVNGSARANIVTANDMSQGSATSTGVRKDISNATGCVEFNEIPLNDQLAIQQTEETNVDAHNQIIVPSTSSCCSSDMDISNAEEFEDVNRSSRADFVISQGSATATSNVVGNDVSNATGCVELNEIPLYNQLAIQETEETSVHAQEQIIMPSISSEMESSNAKKFEDVNGSASRANIVTGNNVPQGSASASTVVGNGILPKELLGNLSRKVETKSCATQTTFDFDGEIMESTTSSAWFGTTPMMKTVGTGKTIEFGKAAESTSFPDLPIDNLIRNEVQKLSVKGLDSSVVVLSLSSSSEIQECSAEAMDYSKATLDKMNPSISNNPGQAPRVLGTIQSIGDDSTSCLLDEPLDLRCTEKMAESSIADEDTCNYSSWPSSQSSGHLVPVVATTVLEGFVPTENEQSNEISVGINQNSGNEEHMLPDLNVDNLEAAVSCYEILQDQEEVFEKMIDELLGTRDIFNVLSFD